jgi:SAM-dependent methyltransferase
LKLDWHHYKYYPYERELALREISALLSPDALNEVSGGVELVGGSGRDKASRLVYFAGYEVSQQRTLTVQRRLEGDKGGARQSTRYSVHGLHEYKGKFNPQIAKALLNILSVNPGATVLDPFCGSGTSLVECAHIGVRAIGTDINPLAVFIANAKLRALQTPARELSAVLEHIERGASATAGGGANGDRITYLRNWFDEPVLSQIEVLRATIEKVAGNSTSFFLAIASNLLREYSQQDPGDLRIRRRSSPLPTTPFASAFVRSCTANIQKIVEAQAVLGVLGQAEALLADAGELSSLRGDVLFDAALTSPPYAMALPYIDTQRLSLVWLSLVEPSAIAALEGDLIGSREMRGKARKELSASMLENLDRVPARQHSLCLKLQHRLSASDGFRRKAVPVLLYRYFSAMQHSFRSVRGRMREGATYALIVGHNHTTIGSVREDIDTPLHLAEIASQNGWNVSEVIPLQTYRRFGLHSSNAVQSESLILLRAAG